MNQYCATIGYVDWCRKKNEIYRWFADHDLVIHPLIGLNHVDWIVSSDEDHVQVYFYTERLAIECKLTFG